MRLIPHPYLTLILLVLLTINKAVCEDAAQKERHGIKIHINSHLHFKSFCSFFKVLHFPVAVYN